MVVNCKGWEYGGAMPGLSVKSAFAFFCLFMFSVRSPAAAEIYSDIYRRALENQLEKEEKGTARLDAGGISPACYAWLLAEKTGEARYRRFALDKYDSFLAQKVNHDFHYSRPFGMLTLELNKAGELTGARRERALDQARQRIDWFLDKRRMAEEYFDCNIALADTFGAACLARVFKDESGVRAPEIQHAVAALGKRIIATGDLNENACNYSSLGICFFLELAELEGWMKDVAESEGFRNMFIRQMEIISPTGRIPEFGDGYFRWNQNRLDFACLLEIAARLYGDASFQQAAARVVPYKEMLVEEDQLFRGYLLLTLSPYIARSAPVLPEASTVLQRRLPGAPDRIVPDKLLLRTGREPGDSMIMIDLYAEGSHAHRFKRPSIGYYETGGVPLFHNLGRRGTSSGQCGNSFWIWEDPTTFPGYPIENEWNTMCVPANYCFPSESDGVYRIGRDILLRNFKTPDLRMLRFDNLRLDGPRGTLLLDGFESDRTWHGNVSRHPGVQLESSSDCTQGDFSQQVNWHIFGSQYCTRLLEEKHLQHTTFSADDYDTLKLDYKYQGRHPHCNLRSLFKQWVDLGDRVLECRVIRAEVQQLDRDARGAVDFSGYNGPDNRLERRIVLTAEGVLVIVDKFTPGLRSHGWAGGQLWQLYALRGRGKEWFESESDGASRLPDGSTSRRRMLVKFMAGPDKTIDVKQVRPSTMFALKADGSHHREFFTCFSKQTLRNGETATAAMAVLPLRDNENAPDRADGIIFEPLAAGGIKVKIASDGGGWLSVSIRGDTVDIERQAE